MTYELNWYLKMSHSNLNAKFKHQGKEFHINSEISTWNRTISNYKTKLRYILICSGLLFLLSKSRMRLIEGLKRLWFKFFLQQYVRIAQLSSIRKDHRQKIRFKYITLRFGCSLSLTRFQFPSISSLILLVIFRFFCICCI